jgi:hypothetical protein
VDYISSLWELDHMTNCRDLLGWVRQEARQWEHLCGLDPFLPSVLLPDGYEGRDAWRLRKRVLMQAELRIRDLF